MKRKTVPVDQVRQTVNSILSTSRSSIEFRNGTISVLEDLLHRSGNYRGFRYLNRSEVPLGELPGIHVDSAGNPLDNDHRFVGTDPTRVQYF